MTTRKNILYYFSSSNY